MNELQLAATLKPIEQISNGETRQCDDQLSIEEPLEIQIAFTKGGEKQSDSLSVTMRTPGDDIDLVVGFLYTEGIIQSMDQIAAIKPTGELSGQYDLQNTLLVELAPGHQFDLKRFQRYFYTNSSCGVCGRNSLQALELMHTPSLDARSPKIAVQLLKSLPKSLQKQQNQFRKTGGIHAAALFSADGDLIDLKEDVGRHNAVDKLIGARLQRDGLPVRDVLLMVSGRVGFELVQKALMADIGFMAAIGAPTSLAVELAEEHNMTLVGFLKETSFNVYAGKERIVH
jgi:FdhD protein